MKSAGRTDVKMGQDVKVREAVEILEPRGKSRVNFDLSTDARSGHGLERHSVECRERRAHDADRLIDDRLAHPMRER